jgi:hypothetical protein
MQEVKLDVPYHSQFLEVNDEFWNIRSCGGACIKMVLDYYNTKTNNIESPSIVDLMKIAKATGGYDMSNGFIHDWAVKYFVSMGLTSHRKEGLSNFNEVEESLDEGNPVIVSIIKRTLEQTKFHLILVVGYEYNLDENGNKLATKVIYHEPESTNDEKGAYRRCDIQLFLESWRGKAIFTSL